MMLLAITWSGLTLAEPQFLWALLLLPVLWWLSQPPKPRQQVWTAHLQQWQLAMRALRRRPPRGSWLRFVLLALAMIAATFAAAQPSMVATPGATRLVVLLDASASMSANMPASSGAQTAWQQAKQLLRERLAQLPHGIEVTVLRCGGDLVRRHGDAARALQDLGVPAGALQVDLVALAEQASNADTAVWTLTDGQGQSHLPMVGALSNLHAAGDNAALVAVRVQDAWPLPQLRLELDLVTNVATTSEVAVQLDLRGAILAAHQQRVLLQSGVTETIAVDLQRQGAGGELVCAVRLPNDCLPTDNQLVLTLPPLPAPRIAVLRESDAGAFAAVAAEALAEEVVGEVVAVTPGVAAGMLLVDGGSVQLMGEDGTLVPRRALTFGTLLRDGATVEPWLAPAPIEWSRTSPLTLGLDLSELHIDRAWRGILPAGEPFLWWQDGDQRVPLAVVVDHGDLASVHLAFRLQDSNLPLLPAFPQLLRRAFVRSYGTALTSINSPPVSPASERDLLRPATAEDRALPAFATGQRDLSSWFVLAGLVALALRSFIR